MPLAQCGYTLTARIGPLAVESSLQADDTPSFDDASSPPMAFLQEH